MSRPNRMPGVRVKPTRIPLCSLHFADCVRLGGQWACPLCMADEAPQLLQIAPNRRARRAVMR